jgi:hypothetical protein
MRTTVTIDPDVAAEIERIRTREGRRFKHVLNDVLRAGLRELSAGDISGRTSCTVPQDVGRPIVDVTDVSAALAHAEGERFR